MPSSLMRKLNAMRSSAPAPARGAQRALIERVYREKADARLFSLPSAALRRLGYCGRAFDVRRALFLDTETTGLSGGAGTVAFLVGVGYVDGSDFVVEQYMMPDYAQETALLQRLSQAFSPRDTVVHFNGKAFDMPLLESRFTLMRLRGLWKDFDQLDLLTPSRRLWKLRLGSCRLSNLEEQALGLKREGDIPGAEIPQRYFDYLKNGDLAPLESVIDHNRQDILSLSALLCVLAEAYAAPEAVREPLDLFSLGKALEKQGEWEQARKLYHVAAMPRPQISLKDLILEKYAGQANYRLYHIYRRNGDYQKAEETLLNMKKRGQMGQTPNLELAKLYEHRLGRPEEALALARELLKNCPPGEREALYRREQRLTRKITIKPEE